MPADASCEGGAPAPSSSPIEPGRVVLIVGPSGAGKDAIIAAVRVQLADDPRFVFPRRVVTRGPNSDEDHETLTPSAFADELQGGAFALHWQAHGLHYAIPAGIDDAVRSGSTVVFNASRRTVPTARARYANAAVVLIDASSEVRAQRLATRRRERTEDIGARLERVVPDFSAADAELVIDNSGQLACAADSLLAWLRRPFSQRATGPAA